MRILKTEALNVAGVLMRNGYEPSHEPVTGLLNEGFANTYHFDAMASREYIIAAVCDGDCTGLRLSISSDFVGQTVVQRPRQDRPVVLLIPDRRMKAQYHLQMEHCNREPCGFALMVFSR